MASILVMERPENWPLEIPGAEVVLARTYLTDPGWSQRRGLKVFNVCRSYRYQSVGYYVSLLAEARGHRPLPSVATIQDLKNPSLVRVLSDDLEELIQKNLSSLLSDAFTLSIYFGENVAKKYQRLSRQLFNLFPAPLLRAEFLKTDGAWQVRSLRPIGAREISDHHRPFVVEQTQRYFSGKTPPKTKPQTYRFDLAILVEPKEPLPPSNDRALRRFEEAAEDMEVRTERITRDDLGRIAEFDGLFIRATTSANHFTFRFSRRAAAEGLAVIDDPESILRCTNKVFLAELLTRHKIAVPKTVILHRDNLDQAIQTLGFPMILKLPDSSFSQGVVRVPDEAVFRLKAKAFLEGSDLLIAQEYLPTEFDWRVGVLNREILFVARYHMARGHWQIIHGDGSADTRYGGVEAVPPEEAPPAVLETGLKAANLMGDGFYGVDLKMRDGQVFVVEVNDNPNLDAGYEDKVGGKEIYKKIMTVFLARMESRRERTAPQ
jgi:glutathione synthase/RimK-type ligase-like ATP-grasp enzyme